MKALSIIQPWAWLIVHGHKPVENRRWPTSFRGQFLIHAGKKFDHEAIFWLREIANKSPVSGIDRIILPLTFARGCIIGRADLVDCVTSHPSPWFSGPYGFVIAQPREIPPAPLRGQLGFFEVPWP